MVNNSVSTLMMKETSVEEVIVKMMKMNGIIIINLKHLK